MNAPADTATLTMLLAHGQVADNGIRTPSGKSNFLSPHGELMAVHGDSTPIVWGDKVFLRTAINTGVIDPTPPEPEDQPNLGFGTTNPNTKFRQVVLCHDRNTGHALWRCIAAEQAPHEGHHADNASVSASPTTDGQRLSCRFGSEGLSTYSLGGEPLRRRDLGKVTMGAILGQVTVTLTHFDALDPLFGCAQSSIHHHPCVAP